ncbi:ABC transporter substrate-binding protein [Saprospira sp. CCB-QB6]|uniref:ABC transporter substrate-binding protein n=1 Tax=Saprospira sp. CCB-QB6 TaxID=3023936 RepID=UPI00234A3D6D|nr:ABC transporter substrate-binding protein [Saprospira sp. CCB-QB6]WCL82241.1 ABC transporter substrate-binding protein [Saprospira sp. CCB-QB6]
MNIRKKTILGLLGLSLCFGSCQPSTPKEGEPVQEVEPTQASKKMKDPSVTVWELDDPDGLNPITSQGAAATYIQNNIFSRLLEFHPEDLKLVPQLALTMPDVRELEEGPYAGGMSLQFTIRPEAKWDNGQAVTAYDYLFTVKAIKNPLVESGNRRPYYEFIDSIYISPENEQEFTIFSKQRYFIAEESAGDMLIMPEYIYNPEGLMKKLSLAELNKMDADAAEKDAELKRFAELFNSPKYNNETVVGSGPYRFVEWSNGQHIILERKKDWWGNQTKNPMLVAYPDKIIHKVVNDPSTAITVARNEEIDVLHNIKPVKFKALKEDKEFQELFELSSPHVFGYYYIAMNLRNPKLQDKKLRQALSHIINRQEIIDVLFEGLATETVGPINPQKDHYNDQLKPFSYDLDRAKELLTEAGWTDSNNDGFLDKRINGKLEKLSLEFLYNQGNEIRKNIGLLLQGEARTLGIEIKIKSAKSSVAKMKAKNGEFELICSAWAQGPQLDELKQGWHSSSYETNGSNYIGFRNEECDRIIDSIRVTLEPQKRKALYFRAQAIIHEEQPYLFLCVPSSCFAIHKRFSNIETSPLRPGYRVTDFQLK